MHHTIYRLGVRLKERNERTERKRQAFVIVISLIAIAFVQHCSETKYSKENGVMKSLIFFGFLFELRERLSTLVEMNEEIGSHRC